MEPVLAMEKNRKRAQAKTECSAEVKEVDSLEIACKMVGVMGIAL